MEFTLEKSKKGAERGQKTRREIKSAWQKSLRMKFPGLSSTYVEFTLGKVPQQFRCLNHIFGLDKRDAESLGKLFGIRKGKHVRGTFSIKLFSLHGVNMGKYQIDILLCPIIR